MTMTVNPSADPESVARGTLALLETRLHHLEFLLSGNSDDRGVPPQTKYPTSSKDSLRQRLEALEADLAKLKRLTGTAGVVTRDLDHLSHVHPDLLNPNSATSDPSNSEDISTLASIVLAHAALYPETASRLSSLKTLQVPSADDSTKLVSMLPRLQQLSQEEQQLQAEAQGLRERSARCLEWWVGVGVVGMGDMWEDWEGRITEVERNVIRHDRRMKEEQGYV